MGIYVKGGYAQAQCSLARGVRLSHRLWELSHGKRASAAKAVERVGMYGTAEAVPFVDSCSQPLKGQLSFMCGPNWPTEQSKLGGSEAQPSLRGLV
jgi:hypothetical protein